MVVDLGKKVVIDPGATELACTRCGTVRPVKEFVRAWETAHYVWHWGASFRGYNGVCKPCQRSARIKNFTERREREAQAQEARNRAIAEWREREAQATFERVWRCPRPEDV